jgi:hypothetical protein
MGSSASTPASSTANLSANDLLVYNINRQKLFNTTIAIAAVYGAIAMIFLIIMLADTNNVSGLSKEYLPFTITFIGGMLVTMIILVAQILTFQPVSSKQPKVSDSICPDYYKLTTTPYTDPDYVNASSTNKNYMGYRCQPDPAVYNLMTSNNVNNTIIPNNNMYVQSNVFGHNVLHNIASVTIAADQTSTSVNSVMANQVAPVYASSTAIFGTGCNLRCDVVYPQFMAYEDSQNFPQSANSLRCQYSKVCNIPWTGVCPSMPSS